MSTCEVNIIDMAKVERVKSTLADTDTLGRLAEVFKAIGEQGRIKIICALLAEEMCVCDLSAAVGMSRSAVSHQLRSLRNLKLVKYRRMGQMVFYSLDDRHIETLLAQGIEHIREAK